LNTLSKLEGSARIEELTWSKNIEISIPDRHIYTLKTERTLRHTVDDSNERTIRRNICWNRRELQEYSLMTELNTAVMMMMNKLHFVDIII